MKMLRAYRSSPATTDYYALKAFDHVDTEFGEVAGEVKMYRTDFERKDSPAFSRPGTSGVLAFLATEPRSIRTSFVFLVMHYPGQIGRSVRIAKHSGKGTER